MVIDTMPSIIHSALERKLPPKIDYGIAFIGCGGIVNYGHIPAYKASGFHMIGGYDLKPEAAEITVQEHGLEKVYGSSTRYCLTLWFRSWISRWWPGSKRI